ncbi:MAG: hypothetical protein R6U87_06400, partial [Thiohalospira sp.]
DPTQAAITDALARLEATSQALHARLAGLETKRPTSPPDLTVEVAEGTEVKVQRDTVTSVLPKGTMKDL